MNNAYVFTNATRVHKANAGFTLIELMISIVLGLLVVAATSQLLLGGIISSRLQQGAADAQDSGLFGLDYIAKDIRLANYGNILGTGLVLTDTTPAGGVVLSATNVPTVTAISDDLLSISDVGPAGVTDLQSDQLTIQFLAPAAMTNCEGANVAAGDRVIQRYFMREDTAVTGAFVLACDAGSISSAGVLSSDFSVSNVGQVIMQRIEHMHVLLGTQAATVVTPEVLDDPSTVAIDEATPETITPGVWQYFTVSDYKALAVKPQIKSIQLSVLVRSLDNTNSAAIDASDPEFTMLDQTVKPTAKGNANRYVRRVYTTTIALRNGLGSPS